jgi:hypothetical protein
MMYFLPVTAIIFLCYLFVGILLMFTPFVFFFSAGTFGFNALITRILPKPFWLRIGISAGLTYGLALILGSLLNTERTAAFNQVASEDVPLSSKPAISRLVLVDDRSETGYDSRHTCDVACKAYLSNRAVSAVLLPLDINDRQSFESRQYTIYSNRIGCAQAQNSNDATNRIWEGGCLAPVKKGKIAIGDIIVHAFKISVPYQSKKCDCERFEVLVQTASGLQLIERKTSFQMTGYGRIPVPSRDAGWNGSNYDHGVSWLREGSMSHREYLENVLKEDLGLSPDVYTVQQAVNEAAARSQAH